jgi:hypothetical protein
VPGVGGAQAGWADRGREEAQRGTRGAVGGRSHGPGGKRKEAGPKSLLGLKSKDVKENQF